MSMGLRIRPGGGTIIQIDGLYENLALKDRGTVVTSVLDPENTTAAQRGIATVAIGGAISPIIAVTCSSFVGLRRRTQDGSSFVFELVSDAPGVAISYYIFDTIEVAQMAFLTSYGLRVRNPQTYKVVFDSRYKYMRVIGRLRATAGTSQVDVATQGDGVAIAMGHTGASFAVISGVIGGGPAWTMDRIAYVAAVKYSPGVASAKAVDTYRSHSQGTQAPVPQAGTFGSLQVDCLLIDVRGY